MLSPAEKQELLSQVKPLVTPDAAPFFPLAAGAWGMFAVFALAVILFSLWYFSSNRRKKKRALSELQTIRKEFEGKTLYTELGGKLCALLKRFSKTRFKDEPDRHLTAYGEEWLKFLAKRSGNDSFLGREGQFLIRSTAMPENEILRFLPDVPTLFKAVRDFINKA